MIPELPKIERWEELNGLLSADVIYDREPLLGYVLEMVNILCPYFPESGMANPDAGVDVFAYTYLNGNIDTSFKAKYENAIELLATLDGFGIDRDKFWYLILFIKDFVDSTRIYGLESLTIKEKLKKLKDDLLDENAKVSIEAKGKIDYNDPLLFSFLSKAIEKALPDIEDSIGYNIIPDDDNKPIAMVYKQYLFHKYMMVFLEGYKQGKKKSIKINGIPMGISYDKTLLISRILYVIGYTSKADDTRFYEEWDDEQENKLNTLKNILRRYQNLDLQTSHGLYTLY